MLQGHIAGGFNAWQEWHEGTALRHMNMYRAMPKVRIGYADKRNVTVKWENSRHAELVHNAVYVRRTNCTTCVRNAKPEREQQISRLRCWLVPWSIPN